MPENKKVYVRVQRLIGGLGDIITSTLGCRAARERYGTDAHITYCIPEVYLHLWFDQFHIGADEIVAPSKDEYGGRLDKYPSPAPDGKWTFVHDLEGPEIRYAQRVRYDLQESRSVTWCKSIDCVPEDMRPRWEPTLKERRNFFKNELAPNDLRPLEYIVVQYGSAMQEKNYPHTDQLIRILRDRGHKVVVIHSGKIPDFSIEARFDDDGNLTQKPVRVYEIVNLPRLRKLALFVESAKVVIGPDSSLTHMAPAVDTPHIGLFGPTSGEVIVKHYPLSEYIQYDKVEGKACETTFPCWGIRYRNYWCEARPRQVPWCLEQVSALEVASRVENTIGKYQEYHKEKLIKLSSDDPSIALNVGEARKVSSKSRRLFVALPAGIGDALWALTKIKSVQKAECADTLVVVACDGSPRRSVDFLKRFRFIESAHYGNFSIHPPNVKHINPDGTYNYISSHRQFEGYDWLLVPNGSLEQGLPLEKWLPGYQIDWEVVINDFQFTEQDIIDGMTAQAEIAENYVVFFMGALINSSPDGDGHNRGAIWKPEDWISLGGILHRKFGVSVCVVGAPYDMDYFKRVEKQTGGRLPSYWHNKIGTTSIGATYDICRRSKGVIGYQSGIPIVSCFLGIPSCSFWRPHGNSISRVHYITFSNEMKDAWVPPWALESKQWLGYLYGQCTPESIAQDMEDAGWFGDNSPNYYSENSSHPLRT